MSRSVRFPRRVSRPPPRRCCPPSSCCRGRRIQAGLAHSGARSGVGNRPGLGCPRYAASRGRPAARAHIAPGNIVVRIAGNPGYRRSLVYPATPDCSGDTVTLQLTAVVNTEAVVARLPDELRLPWPRDAARAAWGETNFSPAHGSGPIDGSLVIRQEASGRRLPCAASRARVRSRVSR